MAECVDILFIAFTRGAAIAIVLMVAIYGGALAMFIMTLLTEGIKEACNFLVKKVRQRRRK